MNGNYIDNSVPKQRLNPFEPFVTWLNTEHKVRWKYVRFRDPLDWLPDPYPVPVFPTFKTNGEMLKTVVVGISIMIFSIALIWFNHAR